MSTNDEPALTDKEKKRKPTIKLIGKKLQLAEVRVLCLKFEMSMEDTQEWLNNLKIPTTKIGPFNYFSMNALEEVLTGSMKPGSTGIRKPRGNPRKLRNITKDGLTPRQRYRRDHPEEFLAENRCYTTDKKKMPLLKKQLTEEIDNGDYQE